MVFGSKAGSAGEESALKRLQNCSAIYLALQFVDGPQIGLLTSMLVTSGAARTSGHWFLMTVVAGGSVHRRLTKSGCNT